jgi:hypothetical protein
MTLLAILDRGGGKRKVFGYESNISERIVWAGFFAEAFTSIQPFRNVPAVKSVENGCCPSLMLILF